MDFGVSHALMASVSVVPCRLSTEPVPDLRESIPVAVGHEPEPLPPVRGTNGSRGEQTPLRIEPEGGKIVEDFGKPSPNKSGDVLQDDVFGCHVSDDAPHVGPEVSVVVNATSLACSGERLARQAGSDDMNSSTPRCAIEGREIVPDRAEIQSRFFHPFHENGRCVAVPLNTTNGSYAEGCEGDGESAVAVAEVEGV